MRSTSSASRSLRLCFGYGGAGNIICANRVMPRLFPNVDQFLALPVRERLRSAAGLRAVGGQVTLSKRS